MRRVSILAAGLAALAVVACQPIAQKQPSETDASAAVCAELVHVAEALDHVTALKPTSTVGEAQTINKHLDKAISGLNAAESELEKARLADYQTKLKAFRNEVAKVSQSKNLTLDQAGTDLKTKATPVLAAHRALYAAVKCQAPVGS